MLRRLLIPSLFKRNARLYSAGSVWTTAPIAYRTFGAVCVVSAVLTATVFAPARLARLDAVPLEPSSLPTNDASEPVTIDPDTGLSFPNLVFISSKAHHSPYTLIGVGVRRISIFSVKVYSVGFYADLSNPSLKIPFNASEEEKITHIISNTSCLFRIIPTRNTSYTHLRDGFLRAIQKRLSLGMKSGCISFEDEPDIQSHILDIIITAPSTIHPNGPGSVNPERSLIVRDMGSIQNGWLASEFALAYFEANGISPPMKKAVLKTLQNWPK